MKIYIFSGVALFALMLVLPASLAFADGGFLSVGIMVAEPDGVVLSSQDVRAGKYEFGPKDVKWKVSYTGDGGRTEFQGSGATSQPFGFDKFTAENGSQFVSYELQAVSEAGVEYSLSENGCKGDLPARALKSVQCTIYATVHSIPAQIPAGNAPTISPAVSSAPEVIQNPQTAENTALIAELTQRLHLLEQLVALLQQLIALQTIQAASGN